MIAPPRQLVLEVSSVCNLHCPQCWIGLGWSGRSGFMSMDLFHKIADEAEGFIRHTYLHLWGEPTLNKNLPAMIRRTKKFSTIDLATHGLNLDAAMADAIAECDTVSVSIDGVTQETYEKYRVGGVLDRALDGLRLLASRCKVRWTFVVFKDNEHEIPAAKKLADEIGVPVSFKSPGFWDRVAMDRSMPSDDALRRFRLVDGEWRLKANRLRCREFWETVYVLPNADVLTCCYDGAAQWVVGNVAEGSLLDAWNGPRYAAMRASHEAGQLNELCQRQCQLPPGAQD